MSVTALWAWSILLGLPREQRISLVAQDTTEYRRIIAEANAALDYLPTRNVDLVPAVVDQSVYACSIDVLSKASPRNSGCTHGTWLGCGVQAKVLPRLADILWR